MFSQAMAQTAGGGAPTGGPMDMLIQIGPIVLLVILFYFLMIRPQQKRQRDHQAMIVAVKRGDTVVLNNGMIGKVVRVEDAEVGVEISQGVTVKVVKAMLGEVRTKGEPAPANDKT